MATTWFITGASRGLGRELTEQALARGDRFAATLPFASSHAFAPFGYMVSACHLTNSNRPAFRKKSVKDSPPSVLR